MVEAAVNNWRYWVSVLMVGLALILAGCAPSTAPLVAGVVPGAIIGAALTMPPAEPTEAEEKKKPVEGKLAGPAQQLASEIAAWLNDDGVERVAVTAFVDVNDLTRTSAFGRTMADALIALLHRQGLEVVELRKTANILIEPRRGEFYLSRQVAHLAAEHQLSAVVVGTYAEAMDVVLISARLVSIEDGQVLSTALIELPKSGDVAYLLEDQTVPPTAHLALMSPKPKTPAIPAPEVGVYERPPKRPAKIKR